jgi:membrane protease YdiL (CAAX protease family)
MSDLSIPDPNAPRYPQALDIQHDTDPAQDHGDARRIPHLGHAALFFAIAIISFFVSVIGAFVIYAVLHPHANIFGNGTTASLPPAAIHLAAVAQLIGYALTSAICFPVFPLIWQRSFLDGIHWTWRAARLRWWKLVLLGVGLSLAADLAEHLFKAPKETTDILKLLDTPLSAWLTAFSAALVAPVVEEIAFRGFLLPAIATAYDWIALERTPAAYNRWRQTTSHTMPALVLATVISSAGFALMHGGQLHGAHGPIIILFCVSLVLSAVRIRYQSVAASALVHVAYNSFLFLVMIFITGGFRHLDKLTQ